METSTMILLAVAIIVVIAALYIASYLKDKKSLKGADGEKEPKANLPMQLQAYERLVLLTDRIALPNLITRIDHTGLGAKEMQVVMVQTIKQEFEHNITQQIYVSAPAWEAVRNLKEQNILIIHQIGSYLPDTATGADLARSIMDLLVENPKASLHNIVSDALSYEAKKLL